MDAHDEYEKHFKSRPHVVILGAGASVAAIPNGDRHGRKTSVMDGFIETLGMREVIADLNLSTQSENLEDIYSELAERTEYNSVRNQLDSSIRNHFNAFEIPDEPTIYDLLILALREKDLIATFNWDPLLLQAYQRAYQITSDIPDLTFLHGNVGVGYCADHERGGLVDETCPECNCPFEPSRLLYPITQKNYASDTFTVSSWKKLERYLAKAYLVTVFGYSAPKTDVEAIDLLKNAWGTPEKRNMEDFEFIDIRDEAPLIESWKDFVHTHHYSHQKSFFDSSLGKFPRRTTEELFDRTQNCVWTSPCDVFSEQLNFNDIRTIVDKLNEEELEAKDGFITLPNSLTPKKPG